MLCLVVVGFLLSCADCTLFLEKNTLNPINRSVSKGETVIFHCNGTSAVGHLEITWRKDGNLIFISSIIKNQTQINYTSSRMQIDPLKPRKLQISDVQPSDAGLYSCLVDTYWMLIIEDNEPTQSVERTPPYIAFSVLTLCFTLCLFIFYAVCLHSQWEARRNSSQTETAVGIYSHVAKEHKSFHHPSDTITSCVYTMTI